MKEQKSGQARKSKTPTIKKSPRSILGLSTSELAGLKVDDIVSNRVAVQILMNYYKELVDENNSQKNQLNTYKTYVDSYERKKTNTGIGAILLALSNILIGFAVNLLTLGNNAWPGILLITSGLLLTGFGLYLSYKG